MVILFRCVRRFPLGVLLYVCIREEDLGHSPQVHEVVLGKL